MDIPLKGTVNPVKEVFWGAFILIILFDNGALIMYNYINVVLISRQATICAIFASKKCLK